jgi:glycerol-3-phosphate acyltransferase PlsX
MRVVLDAMGGDAAPHSTVSGALKAAEAGFPILLVGEEGVLDATVKDLGGLPPNITVHHATQFVEMEDAPRAALRGKRDSSLRVAFELVRNGSADALVSMGHSGAALAMGMFVAGRLPGVLRPAIAVLIPGSDDPVVLLDAGANVDCRPEHLEQFGRMGAALCTVAFGVQRPRVAVLSNGAEDEKGTELTREAAERLGRVDGLDFRGYLEPGRLLTGDAHVVVTDGWTGNIALKTAEGTLSHVLTLMRRAASSTPLARAGGLLLRGALRRELAPLDPGTLGGGLLLGVDACAVIGHGGADAEAVAAALVFAERLASDGLLGKLQGALGEALGAA